MAGSKAKTYANTWAGVTQAAKDAGAKWSTLVAAQWALESGHGKHAPGHNYFGLKGQGASRETREFVDGKWVTIEDSFLEFPDLGACVKYLVTRWYKDWDKYEGVDRAPTLEAAAKELVKQGYATDPAYAEKLLRLVEQHAPEALATPAKTVVKATPKPILYRIEAVQATWLKKEQVQASELGEKEKVFCAPGKDYAVVAYEEIPADGHARVELAAGAGTWFLFEPHWRKVTGGAPGMATEVDWSDFSCLVTPSLSVGEVLQFDKRRIPPEGAAVRMRLLRTAAEFQRIREAWGGPLGVTSFYRPANVNVLVGGVPNSKHVTGEAFDIYPIGRSLESFYQWIRVRWTGGLGDGRARGFVHVDVRGAGSFVPGAGARPVAEWTY